MYRYVKLFAHLTVSDQHFPQVMDDVDLKQLFHIITSPTLASNVIWQCFWAVNNIAMDFSIYRERVLDANILDAVVKVMQDVHKNKLQL